MINALARLALALPNQCFPFFTATVQIRALELMRISR
jgi:hypothetical protein